MLKNCKELFIWKAGNEQQTSLLFQDFIQCLPFGVFHAEEMDAVFFSDLMCLYHIGMAELGGGGGFSLESLDK